MLDGQDVVGVLFGDQELGVLALGMQGVRGDHAPGQVQRLQQRGELGDLIGLAVHAGLGEHGAGLLVGYGEQVHGLPVAAGVTGTPYVERRWGCRCLGRVPACCVPTDLGVCRGRWSSSLAAAPCR